MALRTPSGTRTYAQLGAEIATGAAALSARGVGPGSVVSLALADPNALLAALLATDALRATPLVGDASWPGPQRAAVRETIRPDVEVTEWPLAISAAHQPVQLGPASPTDHAWAGFSSGSTGRPRAVLRTRASWTASYPAVEKLVDLTSDDTVLVPGPLASSLFCFGALHGLAAGATVAVTGRWSPPLVRPFLGEAEIVHLVPHLLEHVVTELEGRNDGRLRVAIVGGAALPNGLRERAAAVGVDVVFYYGAVELSFVAVDTDGRGLRPFDGVEIDVRPVGEMADVGEVWVRSPWTADGYLAGATGPFRRDDGGWVTVGDLADLPGGSSAGDRLADHIDPPLRLRGRGDGAIVTGGATVVPEDVESVLSAVPGVAGAVAVGVPHDRLGAVVTAVIEADGAGVARSVLDDAARRGLAMAQRPRRWLQTDRLPRTPAGKPDRAMISCGLADGSLDVRPVR